MMQFFRSLRVRCWILWIILTLGLTSCASSKKIKRGEFDTQTFYERACKPQSTDLGFEGSVWIRIKDHDHTAQFPAQVRILSEENLYLEVNNLLGAPQAIIEMEQGRYQVTDLRSTPPHTERGRESWEGIPIRWIVRLFLGRVPCPKSAHAIKIQQTQENEIEIQSSDSHGKAVERFTYRFSKWKDFLWLESMTWTQMSHPPQSLDFKLGPPAEDLGIPEKWEIKADQAEIKVRWRSREKIINN